MALHQPPHHLRVLPRPGATEQLHELLAPFRRLDAEYHGKRPPQAAERGHSFRRPTRGGVAADDTLIELLGQLVGIDASPVTRQRRLPLACRLQLPP